MKQPLRKLEELKLAFESLNASIQIVAILAAGFWAFYTFVYEDKIKPIAGVPTIAIENTLTKIGTKGNLIAVKFVSKIRNTGTMRVRFLAHSLYIKGFKVRTNVQAVVNSAKVLDQLNKKGFSEEDRYFTATAPEVLHRSVRLLQGTAKLTSGTLYLDPGTESSVELIFYVDGKRFDKVEAFIRYIFTKNQSKKFPIVTREVTGDDSTDKGFLNIEEANEDPNCTFESPECTVSSDKTASLSVWP